MLWIFNVCLDLVCDDHVGSAVYSLEDVFYDQSRSAWIKLTHKDKPAGEIFVEFDFISDQTASGYPTSDAFSSTIGSYGSSVTPEYYSSTPIYPSQPTYPSQSTYPSQPTYTHSMPPSTSVPFGTYQPTATPPAPAYISSHYPAPLSQYTPSGYTPSGPGYTPPAPSPGYGGSGGSYPPQHMMYTTPISATPV